MGRRLAVTIATVLAVGVLGAPANATHEGIPGLGLEIEGECFYGGVGSPFGYLYAALSADVRAYESRDDVSVIRVQYINWSRLPGEDTWGLFSNWSHRDATANGETVRYDEGSTFGIGGDDPPDYRMVIKVTWIGPTATYTHRFTAAKVIDGVCSEERSYPAA